jgi:hypothetical protein
MTDEAMSPLRRRMSEDAPQASAEDAAMLHSHDQEFRGVSRSLAGRGDLRGCTAFRLHLAETGDDTPALNHAVSAVRFFFLSVGRRRVSSGYGDGGIFAPRPSPEMRGSHRSQM